MKIKSKPMPTIARSYVHIFLLIFTSTFISSCSNLAQDNQSPNNLTISLLPDSNPSLIRKKYKYFTAYLEDKLGKKVKLEIPPNYNQLKSIVNTEKFDIAQINPVIYSMNYNPKTMDSFATELKGGETNYHSVFIVKSDSPYWSINDLKGRLIGMNNKLSTSGYVIPTYMLFQSDLYPGKGYTYRLTGSHQKTTNAVISGVVDAGAVSWKALKSLINNNYVKGDEIRIIDVSMRIPNDVWILRKSLKPSLKNHIRNVFFKIKNTNLDNYLGIDGFVPVDTDEYDIVRLAKKTITGSPK